MPSALTTYEEMAPFYDQFTASHDYELWIGSLLPVADRFGIRGTRLLDVGCGTGKSFMPLLEGGWQVTGCDCSEAMIAVAREKTGDQVRLEVADARELPTFGEFDLVLALDDVVNYLLDAVEVGQFLRGAKRNLAPGGVLMFDANTLLAYRTFFSADETLQESGADLIWRGATPADAAPGVLAVASFEARDRSGQVLTGPAVHHQRHHPPALVAAAIEGAGLRCHALSGHGYDARLEQPLDEMRHTKAIFICGQADGERR